MKPGRREEARARKLFRKLRLGQHYVWVNSQGEKHVIRVLAKRLTLTPTDAKAEMKGTYFFITPKKPSETYCTGHPAYANHDGWETVTPKTTKWQGKRPRHSPVHGTWHCISCERTMKFGAVHKGYSHCCNDEVYVKFLTGGEHDALCVCDDCDPDDKRRSALRGK